MKYQVQFEKETLTVSSLGWLTDFLVKYIGEQETRIIAFVLKLGKTYEGKGFKVVTISE